MKAQLPVIYVSMFRNLLVKFYYKIKQPDPPPQVFVKVVAVTQKTSDFPMFCPMVCPPHFSTFLWHQFKKNKLFWSK